MEEDRRAVLRADVEALAVAAPRVVLAPEGLEQLLVGDLRRVERDLDGLGMPRAVAADLAVGRIRRVPAGVADARVDNAGQRAERGLDAPEAARREGGLLGHTVQSRLQVVRYGPLQPSK